MKYHFWIWTAQCLLIGSGSSAKEETPEEVNAVLGGEVTFPVRIRDGFEIEKIVCTFKGTIIAEMTPRCNYTVRDERFAERLHAVDENGSLKIRNLCNVDSGLYAIEIFNKKKTTSKETKHFELKVFSHVEIRIMPLHIDSANGTCRITFNCTVNNSTSVSYSWSGEKAEPSLRPVMSLSLTESASNLTVCCTVENPASKASVCVLPREHCFPGRVEPHVTTKVTDSANGTCLITFNCTVNDNTSVSYSWSGVKAGPSVGPVMSLSLTESASNLTVCCTVENPVSKASACVFPRGHCFPDASSAAFTYTCGYLWRIIACVSSAVICALVGFIVYRLDQRNDQDLRDE